MKNVKKTTLLLAVGLIGLMQQSALYSMRPQRGQHPEEELQQLNPRRYHEILNEFFSREEWAPEEYKKAMRSALAEERARQQPQASTSTQRPTTSRPATYVPSTQYVHNLNLSNNFTHNARLNLFDKEFTTSFNEKPMTLRDIIRSSIIKRTLGQKGNDRLGLQYKDSIIVESRSKHPHLTLFDFGPIEERNLNELQSIIRNSITNNRNVSIPAHTPISMIEGKKQPLYYIYIDYKDRIINNLQQQLSNALRGKPNFTIPEQVEPHITLFSIGLKLPKNTESEINHYRDEMHKIMDAKSNENGKTIKQQIDELLKEISQQLSRKGESFGDINLREFHLKDRQIDSDGKPDVTTIETFQP